MSGPRRRNTRPRSEADAVDVDAPMSTQEEEIPPLSPQQQQQQQQQRQRPKRNAHKKKTLRYRVRRLLKSWKISSMTLQGSGILIVAIAAGFLFNLWTQEEHANDDSTAAVDVTISSFLQATCSGSNSNDNVYCHASLVPDQRTQKATSFIKDDTTILKIPRRLLILDVDALQNDFVRDCLFATVINDDNNNAVSSTSKILRPEHNNDMPAAFLAAHLARLQVNDKARAGLDPVLQRYVTHVLPSYADFVNVFQHPVAWSLQDLRDLLPPHSASFQAVQARKEQIDGEYKLFCQCQQFATQVSAQQYTANRLSVMTRSFGTGPQLLPPSNELNATELQYYQETLGIDLSVGSHAMVPILDLYNHHAVPNVGFAYKDDAFVVQAVNGGISAGSQVYDSYGKHTDTHLLAKYGFVNGDGSGHTQATLALWHAPDLIDTSNKARVRKQMVRYLQYDDGYEQCVTAETADKDAWEFKMLKYRYLMQLAAASDSWTVMLAPRDPDSRPAANLDKPIMLEPPQFDKRRIQLAGKTQQAFSTCRLLSLTHHDYNGTASAMLTANFDTAASFTLPAGAAGTKDALEFRTLTCLIRLSQSALGRFGVSVAEQHAAVAQLNLSDYQTRNWTAAHVLLGEMQTLEAIKGVAYSSLRAFGDPAGLAGQAAYMVRDKPCPPGNLHDLVQHVQQQE